MQWTRRNTLPHLTKRGECGALVYGSRGVADDTAVLDVLAGGEPQSYFLGDSESNLLDRERLSLRWPPNAGERENGTGVLVGLVVGIDVVAYEDIQIEQAHGDIGSVCFVAGLLGEAAC